MSAPNRILIGSVVAFIIICAGLAAGFYFNGKKPSLMSGSGKTAVAEPNFNTYEISPPSRGDLLNTKEVTIQPAGNISFMLLPREEAGDIKTGQKILLFDSKGVMLETLGEITSVNQGKEQFAGSVMVHMTLGGDETVSVADVKTGKIIISRASGVPRLPLTALIRADDGTKIWEAHENQDGTHTAYLRPVTVTDSTYEFFVIQQPPASGNIFILNPDEKLRDGQKINVKSVLFRGPETTDDSRIARLIEAREKKRFRERFVNNPDGGSNAFQGSQGGGCAPSSNIVQDFLDKTKRGSSRPVPSP